MAGNMNSGRKPTYEAKCVNSLRFDIDTIIKIEELAKRLNKTKSEIIREIVTKNVEVWHAMIVKEKVE